MGINIARFYQREAWHMDCEIITPMFLGNSNQEAELRTAPFKGLLRYWWRVAEGQYYQSPEALLQEESRIFGSPDEKQGGKSRITVRVEPVSAMQPARDLFKNNVEIDHPECEQTKGKIKHLNYLAGMGLVHFKKGIQHNYFRPGEQFRLLFETSADTADNVRKSLQLMREFSAIGSRCRNGWGCFSMSATSNNLPSLSFPYQLADFSREWTEAMDRDYPHSLGTEADKSLLWRTRQTAGSWEECMKDLAIIYVAIRAGNSRLKVNKLEVKRGVPPDRFLLGYPVTHHTYHAWGKSARHGSALRLLVRREGNGFRGYILHLPHLFSTEMWSGGKERQVKIWQQVHQGLDRLCERITLEEKK